MDSHAQSPGRLGNQVPQTCANWIREGNVGRDSFSKERVNSAQTGAVVKLRRQQDIARRVFLLQTAHSGNADDPADVQRTQRPNVCAMVEFMGQNAVSASVPG